MSVLERVPTDRRRLVGALAGAAVVWWVLYSVNLPFWDWLLHDVFGMDPDARLTETLHFFFYDTVKITLLLCGIILLVTVLRSFMSVERTRALLGCANCHRLEANAKDALATLGLDATIEKVTDFADIASYGVMRTPGLVVDEQVLVSGRVPDANEIATLLSPSRLTAARWARGPR